MNPTGHIKTIPGQAVIYCRGNEPGLALPAAGEIILTPGICTCAIAAQEFMNHEDSSIFPELPSGRAHGPHRFAGVWNIYVYLLQDQIATVGLEVKTFSPLLSLATPGLADDYNTVLTRAVAANVPFRQAWVSYAPEVRVFYENDPQNAVTDFEFTVIARAV